jgi:hypothetical protein
MMNYWGLDKNYSKSVACSGATTSDILGDDTNYWGQGDRLGVNGLNLSLSEKARVQEYSLEQFIPGRIHQISFAAKNQPSVISIGIGGNDVGFGDKLEACLMIGICEWAGTAEGREKTAVEIKGLFDRLVQVYQEVHNSSPNAEIFAIGYPKLIDENNDCNLVDGYLLDGQERVFINYSTEYLNTVIHMAAIRAGIRFISNYDSFDNNILCGSGPKQAMNSLRGGDDIGFGGLNFIGQESFHPTPEGHEMLAASFYEFATNPITNPDYCFNYQKACSNERVFAPEPPSYFVPEGYHDYSLQHVSNFISETNPSEGRKVVRLDDDLLQPNSSVQIVVASEPRLLGNFTTDPAGNLNVEINLPSDLPTGSHTMHIYGIDKNNKKVDLYQVFYYQKIDTPTVLTGTGDTVLNSTKNNISPTTDMETGVVDESLSLIKVGDEPAVLSSMTKSDDDHLAIIATNDDNIKEHNDELFIYLPIAVLFVILLVLISNRARKTSGK